MAAARQQTRNSGQALPKAGAGAARTPVCRSSAGQKRSIFANLLAVAKDREGIWAQLVVSCGALEEQLQQLRSDHDTLSQEVRICLDRGSRRPISPEEKRTPGQTVEFGPREVRETVAGGTPPRQAGRELAPVSQAHGGSPMARGRSVEVVGQCQHSPAVVSIRGRSTSTRLESPCSRNRSTSSRSTASLAAEAIDFGRSSPTMGQEAEPSDLYSVMQPLLDRSSGVTEQQCALRRLQRALRSNPEPPNSWSGPGTPLHAVVRAGRADLARLLLRARADATGRDRKGVTPLHLAVFDGSMDMVRMLLTARADVDACDCFGQSPLFFSPSREICRALLERRADPSLLNCKGQSALHLAGRAGLSDVLSWLSSRVTKALVDHKDVHGSSARSYVQQTASVPKGDLSNKPGSGQLPIPMKRPTPKGPAAPMRYSRAESPAGRESGQAGTGRISAAGERQLQRRPAAGQVPGNGRTALSPPRRRTGNARIPEANENPTGKDTQLEGVSVWADIDGSDQQLLCDTAGTTAALEAAAALATAAVATAAELEPTKSGAVLPLGRGEAGQLSTDMVANENTSLGPDADSAAASLDAKGPESPPSPEAKVAEAKLDGTATGEKSPAPAAEEKTTPPKAEAIDPVTPSSVESPSAEAKLGEAELAKQANLTAEEPTTGVKVGDAPKAPPKEEASAKPASDAAAEAPAAVETAEGEHGPESGPSMAAAPVPSDVENSSAAGQEKAAEAEAKEETSTEEVAKSGIAKEEGGKEAKEETAKEGAAKEEEEAEGEKAEKEEEVAKEEPTPAGETGGKQEEGTPQEGQMELKEGDEKKDGRLSKVIDDAF